MLALWFYDTWRHMVHRKHLLIRWWFAIVSVPKIWTTYVFVMFMVTGICLMALICNEICSIVLLLFLKNIMLISISKSWCCLMPLQIIPPPISRTDFDKVLARQRPTVSKADLDVHERFTKEFGEEGWGIWGAYTASLHAIVVRLYFVMSNISFFEREGERDLPFWPYRARNESIFHKLHVFLLERMMKLSPGYLLIWCMHV